MKNTLWHCHVNRLKTALFYKILEGIYILYEALHFFSGFLLTIFIGSFLCVRYPSKFFIHISLFNPHNKYYEVDTIITYILVIED
jgi:hypothetical protein